MSTATLHNLQHFLTGVSVKTQVQRNAERRAALQAAGKCVDCADPSETYRCLPCRKARSAKKHDPTKRPYNRLRLFQLP